MVTTDRSKLSSDEKRLIFAVNLYIFNFLGTLPLIIIILFIKNAEACLAHGADVKELLEEPLKVLNKKKEKENKKEIITFAFMKQKMRWKFSLNMLTTVKPSFLNENVHQKNLTARNK